MASPTLQNDGTTPTTRGMHMGERIAIAAILVPLILGTIGVYGQALLTKSAVERNENKLMKLDELNARTIRIESKIDTVLSHTNTKP